MIPKAASVVCASIVALGLGLASCHTENETGNEPERNVSKAAFVYVAGGGNVSILSLDDATGALTPAGAANAGTSPCALAMDPEGRFLYAADSGVSGIRGYAVAPATGALAATPGSPYAGGGAPSSAVVHPSGRFLYSVNYGNDSIDAYSIDGATGELRNLLKNYSVLEDSPTAVAVHPSGKFLFVANGGHGWGWPSITSHIINPGGTLTCFDFHDLWGILYSPRALAMDPAGNFLYLTDDLEGYVVSYGIGPDGSLTAISRAATGSGPVAAVVTPSGKFLYTANSGSGNISAFALADGAPVGNVAGQPFPAGIRPRAVAVDPSGRHLLVTNEGDDTLSVFEIDPATGALAEVSGSPFAAGADPRAVVVRRP